MFTKDLDDHFYNKQKISKDLINSFEKKIEAGLKKVKGKRFLHTSPHHDDVMLGYLPYILNQYESNCHYFASMTSGFNAVSDLFLLDHIRNLESFLECQTFNKEYFSDSFVKTELVFDYLQALAANDKKKQKEVLAKRMILNLIELFELDVQADLFINDLKNKIKFLKNDGKKENISFIQSLKGMLREWEEEVLWGHFGFSNEEIFHMRLGFYSGCSLQSKIEYKRDVKPILSLFKTTNPDIITVAIDHKGYGPNTHYKVLNIMQLAVKDYLKENPSKKDLMVLGYRNIWSTFQATEANVFVPVSLSILNLIKSLFLTSYKSQQKALFPVSNITELFCDNAIRIMIKQYEYLKNSLGQNYFYKNKNKQLSSARGFCFLKQMSANEFVDYECN